MIKTRINENFEKLPDAYLFVQIRKKLAAFTEKNPDAKLIKMGIGDITQALPHATIDAMHKAVDELSSSKTVVGYGPEHGHNFLREEILQHDFKCHGIDLDINDIFVSDGAKSDTGNIVDLFDQDTTIAVTDPVYPVYVDSNAIAGRTGEYDGGRWSRVTYLPCNAENNFIPDLPKERVDLIYLCYPNNPTGTVLSKEQLKVWVDYARHEGSIIMFDAAYEAFIREPGIPHSIFEIDGAKECAIEFRSFSKTAGFTGVRGGYTVIPQQLMAINSKGEKVSINKLWDRRQSTKFNGSSYIMQRGAQAIFSPVGQHQVKMTIDYYLKNAKLIRETLESEGYEVYGGINSPYVWMRTPDGQSSWEFFDYMLEEHNIVITPGVGFGAEGEGYIRFSAFADKESTKMAMERIKGSVNKE